jgi:hypothetical protein
MGRVADSIWKSLLVDYDGVAGSFGDSAQGWGATAASALDSAILSRVLHRIVWGTVKATGSDSSTIAEPDVADTVNAILDSLQLYDVIINNLSDIDSADFNDDYWNVFADNGSFVISDTTASGDSITNFDTISDAQVDEIGVNVTSISGDALAADSLEYALDGGVTTILEGIDANQTDITTILTYTDGDASDGIELQVDRNRPSEWLVADSNKFYGLVWSAAVDTPKIIDPAMTNGDSIGTHPSAWTAAETTVYQGSGADATPSQWDVTDSAIFYGLVWSAAVDTTKEIDAVASNGISIDNDFTGNWGTAQFEDSVFYVGNFKVGNVGANGWIREGAFQTDAINSDAIKDGAIRAEELGGTAADEIADSTWLSDTLSTGDSGQMGEWMTLGGSGGAGIGDSTITRIDSIYNAVGWPGESWSPVTLHMKQGAYTGATGNNIEDDFDSVFADIAALSLTGGGTEPETIIVLSVGDTTQIQTAVVVVRTLDQSTVKVPGLTTDVNGKLILELGDGVGTDSFFVATSHNNYIYKTDTIAVASGGGTDTVWMTQFSPNSPTDTGKVTLYVWTDDILGDTLEGATFAVTPITKSKNWRTDGGRVILPQTVTKATDSLGYAEIEVYQSAYVHPYKYKNGAFETDADSLKYNITIYKSDYGRFDIYNYTAPSDTSDQIGGN